MPKTTDQYLTLFTNLFLQKDKTFLADYTKQEVLDLVSDLNTFVEMWQNGEIEKEPFKGGDIYEGIKSVWSSLWKYHEETLVEMLLNNKITVIKSNYVSS